jgi:uncharacterized protein
MVKKALIFIVRTYKKVISPFLKNACRHYPTCSEYAIEAVDKHGAFKGMGLALIRLLKCHPYSKGGYDPVP